MVISIREWYKLEPGTVRRDKALFNEFRTDFLNTFGESVNQNCGVCWLDYFAKMYKHQIEPMEKATTAYKLFPKYNGIQFKGKIVRQFDMTDKKAEQLIKSHPHGIKLFAEFPKQEAKKEPKKPTKKATTDKK